MATQICDLIEEGYVEQDLDYDNQQSIVMDLSVSIHNRIEALVSCYNQDKHRAVECLSTLISQYQMSGIKILEAFLRRMCDVPRLPSFFRLEAAKALLEYEELEDDTDDEDDEETVKSMRIENEEVRKRNIKRTEVGSSGLEAICSTMGEIPTPCRVEAVCLLMKYTEHKPTAERCFLDLVNDVDIECSFRYRCILDLENRGIVAMRKYLVEQFDDKDFVKSVYDDFSPLIKREFPNFKPTTSNQTFFILLMDHINYNQVLRIFRMKCDKPHIYEHYLYHAQVCFMETPTNPTSYRILAAQYLLQKFSLSIDARMRVQETLLEFAGDSSLDNNLRADATDVLMQLGDERTKQQGRDIILELGRSDGEVITVFDNSQNVHNSAVEESVAEVIEFFAGIPLMKITDEVPINFSYVSEQITNMLKAHKLKRMKQNMHIEESKINCAYCDNGIPMIQSFKALECEFCSEQCMNEYTRDEHIKLALNRIEMDRALYSRYNSTLSNLLLKVWTYINDHEHEEEMKKRLLQELEEMSGTCSSGFASRLINVVSGFGEFNIRISWEDQIKSNFFGRLSAAAKLITTKESIFRNNPYLTDLVMLCLNEEHQASGEDSIKERILEEYRDEYPTQTQFVDTYLQTERDIKIRDCLQQLQENVLNEMIVSSSMSSERQYFSLFFRSHVAAIREEMYQEFTEHMDDTTFDLYMRKAMMHYEGII